MDLIIGGAFQGKLTYAVNKYSLQPDDCFDLSAGLPESPHKCLYHLEALTKKAHDEGITPGEMTRRLLSLPQDTVIISREIGCGVVPMDPIIRSWREYHGIILARLAKDADSVTRIFCGLAEKLA